MGVRSMGLHRSHFRSFVAPGSRLPGRLPPPDFAPPGLAPVVDWATWLRAIERKRRLVARATDPPDAAARRRRPVTPPLAFYAGCTYASFRLDDIDVSDRDVFDALSQGAAGRRAFRSRLAQRVRNHVAILIAVETDLRLGRLLKPAAVIRWYTSVSSGLSTTGLDDPTMDRLDAAVRRINSPQMRVQSALREIARLHVQLLADPLVPGFNGILARLLLRYHLGRSNLPPVLFAPDRDRPHLTDEPALVARLMELIDESLTMQLTWNAGAEP